MEIIFEIGAGDGNFSRTKEFWGKEGYFCYLFEPNPIFYQNLVFETSKYNNIITQNICIWDTDELVNFYIMGNSSFIEGVISPFVWHTFRAAQSILKPYKIVRNAFKISNFDKGINTLILDCEGCEWFCLKNLISRPEKIVLAYYNADGYQIPFIQEIQKWLNENKYSAIKQDNDTITFLKNN